MKGRKPGGLTEPPSPEQGLLKVVIAESGLDGLWRVVVCRLPLCDRFQVSILHDGELKQLYFKTLETALKYGGRKRKLRQFRDISEEAIRDYRANRKGVDLQ